MSQDVHTPLQWWMSPLNQLQGVQLHSPPSLSSSSSPMLLPKAGGPPYIPPDLQQVVPLAEVSTHQQPGTASRPPRTTALPSLDPQHGCDSDDRQHHSHQPDQESRWHSLTIPVPPHCPPSRVGGQHTHHLDPTPHSRTFECGGRSPGPETPDHQLQVDTVSPTTPPRVAPLGPTPHRPLCHIGNCLSAHVRLTTLRPGSMED